MVCLVTIELRADCGVSTGGRYVSHGDVPILGRHIGFGATWPMISLNASGDRRGTWKLSDVGRWCESNAAGRPVAWLDDDLWPDAYDWAMVRGQTLILRTLPEEGLTDAQTEELLAWAGGRGDR